MLTVTFLWCGLKVQGLVNSCWRSHPKPSEKYVFRLERVCHGCWWFNYVCLCNLTIVFGVVGVCRVVMPLISLIIIQICWVLQVSKIWWHVDAVWISVAVMWLTSDCFRILVIHMIDIGIIELVRVGVACCLAAWSCWFLDYLCVDGWFIHQIADLCLMIELIIGEVGS